MLSQLFIFSFNMHGFRFNPELCWSIERVQQIFFTFDLYVSSFPTTTDILNAVQLNDLQSRNGALLQQEHEYLAMLASKENELEILKKVCQAMIITGYQLMF
jgi:hypothetical protein